LAQGEATAVRVATSTVLPDLGIRCPVPRPARKFTLDNLMDFDLAQGLELLERTPGTLRALLAGLPPAWTDATEGPDT
jgi:hypothetical protein